MIELLGIVFGGLARWVPHVFQLWHERREQDHEYRMTQLQLQIDQARATQQIDLVHANTAAAVTAGEMQAWGDAIRLQSTPTGVPWIDAISASVRPLMTYWHCLVLYSAAKIATAWLMYAGGAGGLAVIDVLVSEFDKTLIGSMMSFWFVDRSLRKGGK